MSAALGRGKKRPLKMNTQGHGGIDGRRALDHRGNHVQGAQGFQGAQGLQGAQGSQGAQGASLGGLLGSDSAFLASTNNIEVTFLAFAGGMVVLLLMWLVFAVRILAL